MNPSERLTAVDLDDLAELLQRHGCRLPDPEPSALGDQLAAADDEQSAVFAATAKILGTDVLDVDRRQVEGWVRLLLLDATLSFLRGQSDLCMHSPSPRCPEILYAAARRPNLIVCAQCTHLLHLKKGSTQDRTCDGCGTVVPHDIGLRPRAIKGAAPITLMFGTCDGCTQMTVPA